MAINSSTPSKYGPIISESKPIQIGSPTIFQLRPKEENIGSLRTMTVGEKKASTVTKSILVVGETGTGKSTLINALVNYAMGVEWDDDIWFQIVKDEKKSQDQKLEEEDEEQNQCESQTSDVIVYQIFGFEGEPLPFSLSIIDTPGYGATRGLEHDDIVSDKLYEYFNSGEGITEIDAVGLVLKATENRVNDRLRYVFDSALSLFGKNMENNIVALMTHSPGRTPKNALKALEAAKIKCARNENNQPVYFLFDNCQHEDRTEDPEDLKRVFDVTTRGIKQFTKFLQNTAPKKMKVTVDVLHERVRLTACIDNLQERVQFIELQQREIKQEEELLVKYEEKMRQNQNFTKAKDVPYKDRVSADDKVTSCKVCEENCHNPCGSLGVKCCKSMKAGHCTVCTGECPVSDHVLEKKKYENKTRRVYVTKDDMKRKYEEYKAGSQSKSRILQNLKEKMEALQRDKDKWLDKSFQHIITLEQIALNANAMSTLMHLDFLIEKMQERGDTDKSQTLTEIRNRMDEGTKAGIKYKQSAARKVLQMLMK